MHLATRGQSVESFRAVVVPGSAQQLVDVELFLVGPAAPDVEVRAVAGEGSPDPRTGDGIRQLERPRPATRVRPRAGPPVTGVAAADLEDDPPGRKLRDAAPVAHRARSGNERPHVVLLRGLGDAVVRAGRSLVVPVTRQIERERRGTSRRSGWSGSPVVARGTVHRDDACGVILLDGVQVADPRVHDGCDELTVIVGVVETQYVTELVNGHTPEILEVRLEWTPVDRPAACRVENDVRI